MIAAAEKTFSREKIKVKIPARNPSFPTREKAKYTILCPQMAPIHFELAQQVFENFGFHLHILPEVNRETIEEGLRYVNNDVCFPAIVAVGQLIQAIKSGDYDPGSTALLISQTCGGCRSTNYATFLRIAAMKAGFGNIPIIPFNINITHSERSEGIPITFAMIKQLFYAFLYGDLLQHLSNRCRPYERVPGSTQRLVQSWSGRLREILHVGKPGRISEIASQIIGDFEHLDIDEQSQRPKVGIVGEILVKYHPGANNDLLELIESEGGEVVLPNILDFVLYCLISDQQRKTYSKVSFLSILKSNFVAWIIERQRGKVRKILSESKRFSGMGTIAHLVEKVKNIVSTCNHTGEGWLLTAEMVEMLESDSPNIICVQPFGCLPNHITGKGVMKELRNRYENANIAAIDYDPGTTQVNQLNRIKLLISVALRNQLAETP